MKRIVFSGSRLEDSWFVADGGPRRAHVTIWADLDLVRPEHIKALEQVGERQLRRMTEDRPNPEHRVLDLRARMKAGYDIIVDAAERVV